MQRKIIERKLCRADRLDNKLMKMEFNDAATEQLVQNSSGKLTQNATFRKYL